MERLSIVDDRGRVVADMMRQDSGRPAEPM